MTLPHIAGEFRLVADPDLKFTQNGKQVANVRLAANSAKKDQTTGEWVQTDQVFLNASLWGDDAEHLIEAGAAKGDKVVVTGQLATREFDKQDGSKGLSVEVKWAKVAVLAKKGANRQPVAAGAPSSLPADDPWAVPPTNANPPF